MPVKRDSRGRFKRKPQACQTCETRLATRLTGFADCLGTFFMCDDCQCPPEWAARRAQRF